MRRVILVLFITAISTPLFSQNDNNIIRITEKLYSLYQEYMDIGNASGAKTAEDVLNSIHTLYESLSIDEQERVIDLILNDLVSSFEQQDNTSFLFNAERALVILPQEEESRFDILSSMAEVYANQNNRELLQATINQMKQTTAFKKKENSIVVESLQWKADVITPFSQAINGYWISNMYMTSKEKEGQPWLYFDIYSNNNGKWANISELSGLSTSTLNQEYSPLRKSDSFDFDVKKGTFLFSFHSNRYRQGDASMANSMYDSAQDARASFHAMAQDNRATLGQSVAAEAIGGLMAVGFELIGQSAATSRMTDDVIYLSGIKTNNNTLNVHMDYQQTSMNSYSMTPYTSKVVNKDFELWRWKKEYNIVFGQSNCKPISPYVTSLTKDMELYKIKKNTSFWNFKYGGVVLLGIGLGAASTYYGITRLPKESIRSLQDQYGISEEEARQIYNDQGYNKDLAIGLVSIILGSAITITVPIVEGSIRSNNRAKAVGKYNKEQYDKFYNLRN